MTHGHAGDVSPQIDPQRKNIYRRNEFVFAELIQMATSRSLMVIITHSVFARTNRLLFSAMATKDERGDVMELREMPKDASPLDGDKKKSSPYNFNWRQLKSKRSPLDRRPCAVRRIKWKFRKSLSRSVDRHDYPAHNYTMFHVNEEVPSTSAFPFLLLLLPIESEKIYVMMMRENLMHQGMNGWFIVIPTRYQHHKKTAMNFKAEKIFVWVDFEFILTIFHILSLKPTVRIIKVYKIRFSQASNASQSQAIKFQF